MRTQFLAATLFASLTFSGLCVLAEDPKPSDPHGWIGTETIKTRFGNFEFKNGYPTLESGNALLDQLKFNRAVEVYLTQMPAVAIIESRRGIGKGWFPIFRFYGPLEPLFEKSWVLNDIAEAN